MPDIGGIGRGLVKGALSATEKAAEKVKDAAEAASRRMADDDPDATQVVDIDAPDVTQVIPGAQTATPHSPVALRPVPAAPQGFPSVHVPAIGASGFPSPNGPAAGLGTPGSAFPAQGAGPALRHNAPDAGPVVSGGPADEPSLADEPEDHADASEVRELVEMFQQLLARRRPPEGPIPGNWSIGVGDLLAEHPKVPKRVRGLVVRLNRFGGVAYSPQEIAFDGDDVPWGKVTELRTRHVVDYLVGDAVQQQVENLPMPWFPGRKRLLDALGQALLTITIATAKNELEKFELDLRVPAEVVYKASFGRSKELNAGVVSALVLVDPAVNRSVIATVRARGITVTAADDELLANADERADMIREKVKALEAELDRFTKRFGRSG
ncbi:hypothetical protein [Actinophytocola glycyrrhizae]|uniref:Uncharacterized protein n=1 Tax=Actinophytocola glycyrrhizae TaxID=2044873 RepID=A0ABV9SEE4_9PSEU